MLLKNKRLTTKKATRLYHKRLTQALRNTGTFQCDISGQTVAVGRVTFAADQGQQITPARARDAESVRRNKAARHLLFLIGDGGQRRFADAPAIGFR